VTKKDSLKSLQTLRNIGVVTSEKLYSIGIKTPKQLLKSDPEVIYEKLKFDNGGKLDRCVLYQLKGAILDIPWPFCKNIIEIKDEK